VELDALGGQLAVADGHDRAIRARRALEALGQLGMDDERVVARGGQRAGEPGEDRAPVVVYLGRLAVDRLPAHDAAAERRGKRLVAEADAERGHPGLGEAPDRRHRHARLRGRARAR
jgi:hypothetical protein